MASFNSWAIEKGRPFSPLQVFFLKLVGVVVAVNVCVVFSVSYMENKLKVANLQAIFVNLVDQISNLDDLPEPQKQKTLVKLRTIGVKFRPYLDALEAHEQ